MTRIPAAVLGLAAFLAVAAGTALATEIPQTQLDSDFKECMQSCTDRQNPEAKCNAFCKCTNEGAQNQFSYEEYQKLANDLHSGALADQTSLGKLKSIASSCSQQFLQP